MRAFGYARAFVCLSTLFPLSRLITGHQQRYIYRFPCSFIHGALTSRRFSSAGRDFNMSGVSGDLLPAETNPTVFGAYKAYAFLWCVRFNCGWNYSLQEGVRG